MFFHRICDVVQGGCLFLQKQKKEVFIILIEIKALHHQPNDRYLLLKCPQLLLHALVWFSEQFIMNESTLEIRLRSVLKA